MFSFFLLIISSICITLGFFVIDHTSNIQYLTIQEQPLDLLGFENQL